MAKHRLVTIGDSVTHGVRSGAAVDGTLAWPRFLAGAMGIGDSFRAPVMAEPRFGLPINLEVLIGHLSERFGSRLDWYEVVSAAFTVRSWMDELEDYWEEGRAVPDPAAEDGPYHNLAVMGFDLRDALSMTAAECDRRIPGTRRSDDFINQVPEDAGLRAARRILASAGPGATVFDAARSLAADGGIEVLVVMLGANNALKVATELRLQWSGPGYDDLDEKGRYSLWQPDHFSREFALVAQAAESVGAEHTILCTVPNVTIVPLARGVGDKVTPGSPYFEYYTRVWISDDDFSLDRDPHITHLEAADTDAAIAAYNSTIRSEAEARGWALFPMNELLDSMASRRYVEDADARPPGFAPYRWPAPLDRLDPVLGTRYLRSANGKRTQGGIFSLDGIHPTVIGSALIAHEMAGLLTSVGVPDVGRVDLGAALAADALLSDPPEILDSILGVIGWLDETADVFQPIVSLFTG